LSSLHTVIESGIISCLTPSEEGAHSPSGQTGLLSSSSSSLGCEMTKQKKHTITAQTDAIEVSQVCHAHHALKCPRHLSMIIVDKCMVVVVLTWGDCTFSFRAGGTQPLRVARMMMRISLFGQHGRETSSQGCEMWMAMSSPAPNWLSRAMVLTGVGGFHMERPSQDDFRTTLSG
jgi:hypothetical protein